MATTNEEIVLRFLQAVTDEQFDEGKAMATGDLTFAGVMGSRNGADAYFEDMKKMRFKYAIEKTFASSDGDVCVWYNINMGGKTILTSGWYTLSNNKIKSIKVVFDPRPLLEK